MTNVTMMNVIIINNFYYQILNTRSSRPYSPFLLAPAEGCGDFAPTVGLEAPFCCKWISPLNLPSNFVQNYGVTFCLALTVSK